ncbi:hypothetical protein LCGC14_2390150, partial [marine sediment metagenome]
RQLTEAERTGNAHLGPVPLRQLTRLLRRILEISEGQYLKPDIVWPLGRHRVRITEIEITRAELTVHVVPADQAPAPAANGRLRAASVRSSP